MPCPLSSYLTRREHEEWRGRLKVWGKGLLLEAGKKRRIQRKKEHGMSSVSTTWGWGSLRTATVWGVHSWLFCACSDIVLRKLGVRVGAVWWKLFSMLNLPKANFWEVWTKVSKTLPSLLPPYACCSEKSSGITASRCGLQMWPGTVPGR